MRPGARAGVGCRQQSQGVRKLVEHSKLRFLVVLEGQQGGEITVTQEEEQGVSGIGGGVPGLRSASASPPTNAFTGLSNPLAPAIPSAITQVMHSHTRFAPYELCYAGFDLSTRSLGKSGEFVTMTSGSCLPESVFGLHLLFGVIQPVIIVAITGLTLQGESLH